MEKGKNVRKNENSFTGNRSNIESTRVRILLCDISAQSCCEVSGLLCQCSYQVSSVWSATEVFGALNSYGPQTDIILAEVELLMANNAEMLRYIMDHKDLQHIPVIILSTREQVSVTLNGLRLGAADYLVKPLQAKELSSLWMHVRRRMNQDMEGCCSRIEDVNI